MTMKTNDSNWDFEWIGLADEDHLGGWRIVAFFRMPTAQVELEAAIKRRKERNADYRLYGVRSDAMPCII